MSNNQEITGQIIDLHNYRIFPGRVQITDGRIKNIEETEDASSNYILPGFVDSHIHIESSMLTPYEFSRKALIHGTVATISDPHEIANVCGLEGIYYMIENAKDAGLKIHFGAPSCVPATSFETAGATILSSDIELLMSRLDIKYLSEMMNYPGVLNGDEEVMKKIAIAKKYGKQVDGHAPGLTGTDAINYIAAGISTDHECFTKEEALFKIKHGMKILIREGSAARNFEALHELITEYPDMVMLCSDDKHPDELLEGHINLVVKRALKKGHRLLDVLRCASLNPVLHYKMDVGLLRVGDPADFIVIDNTDDFNILQTYINGQKMADSGSCVLPAKKHSLINQFNCDKVSTSDFAFPMTEGNLHVIEAIDGQLITNKLKTVAKTVNGSAVADVEHDILKLAVVNRYSSSKPAVSFIKNFNIQSGALASTVAHDSHNIIAVGTDDEWLTKAVNLLVESKGGLCAIDPSGAMVLPLPIAGLMSDLSCDEIGEQYSNIDKKVKAMGCTLRAPFMTLSFMALLVIPKLKLSDKGLFDAESFSFVYPEGKVRSF